MLVKNGLIILILIIITSGFVNGHVCGDVVNGGQSNCPDPQTVKYVSYSAKVNRMTIVTDITAKHVQYKQGGCTCTGDENDGCYDNNDYGNCNTASCYKQGFTVRNFDFDVEQGDENVLSFSSDPSTSYKLNDQETKRFEIYIDVDSSAPSQHFEIDVGMKGSLSGTIRPIYTLDFDWKAEGCSSNSDCSRREICCEGVCINPVCSRDSDCSVQTCKLSSCNNGGKCNAGCSYSDDPSCSGEKTVCTDSHCDDDVESRKESIFTRIWNFLLRLF